jgi:hypothetical protein
MVCRRVGFTVLRQRRPLHGTGDYPIGLLNSKRPSCCRPSLNTLSRGAVARCPRRSRAVVPRVGPPWCWMGVVDRQSGSEKSGDKADGQEPAADGQEARRGVKRNPARRKPSTEKILVDAERRDDDANARDAVSEKREMAADLQAFLSSDEAYNGVEERRAAALDRSHAKVDREASAEDRVQLSDPDSEPRAGEGSAG